MAASNKAPPSGDSPAIEPVASRATEATINKLSDADKALAEMGYAPVSAPRETNSNIMTK